jgi:hypothetical protein
MITHSPGYDVIVTPGEEKSVSVLESPYRPPLKHPVCPELNESSNLWTVRNGLAIDPLLLSDPDGDATRSQRTAADAGEAAAPSTAIDPSNVSPSTRRAARVRHLNNGIDAAG